MVNRVVRSTRVPIPALADAAQAFPELCKTDAGQIVSDLAKLEAESALLAALQRRSFIEKGLELVDGPECPLCDMQWEDEELLRSHLQAKLAKSEEARVLQESLRSKGSAISEELIRIVGLIGPVHKLAQAEGQAEFCELLAAWKTDLDELRPKLGTIDGLTGLKDRMISGWVNAPGALSESLESLTDKVKDKPDQSAALNAQTFLTTSQIRLDDYRTAMRKEKLAGTAAASAKAAYDTYCSVSEGGPQHPLRRGAG